MSLYEELKNLIKNGKLKSDQTITLCYTNEFGFLTSLETKFYYCEEVPLYNNCPKDKYMVRIYHIPRGKRKMRITNISSSKSIVIYDGYVHINDNELNYHKTKEDGLEIFKSKYTCFNSEFFNDLIKKHPNYIFCKV